MSHTATLSALNRLGVNHDAKVTEWRDSLCEELGVVMFEEDEPRIEVSSSS